MESTDKNSLFLRYKKRFQYKQRLWNILSIVYTAVKAAGGNGLQYAVEDHLHNNEHCFDRLKYKAEQVDEKAA